MSERIDHAAEASRLLASSGPYGAPLLEASTAAQAHATLALVEQQRIANLIALSQAEDGNGWTSEQAIAAVFREHWDDEREQGHCTIAPNIAAALGIGGAE